MKGLYDIVYLTNTPSFYKLNLCDRLGKEGIKVLLVFYGYGAEAVNTSLKSADNHCFDYHFLNEGDSHRRSKLKTLVRLICLSQKFKTKKLLYSGWLAPEYNIYSFLSPKRKNVVIIESGYESTEKGLKGWLKKRIMSRMGTALPSGKPHIELLKRLQFNGDLFNTGSVGIFHKTNRPTLPHKPQNDKNLRFLYVGRLIECKNLRFLIENFNKSGLSLTIVGKGELEQDLRSIAKPNISFTGFIENKKLGDIYQSHDVFILPSISEPWGLVVEEAIYWGLPVIVSDRVGANLDLVNDLGTGVIFRFDNHEDLNDKITKMQKNFANFATAVSKIDFDERDKAQISAYKRLIRN